MTKELQDYSGDKQGSTDQYLDQEMLKITKTE
jgi:hypothetical protein